MSADSSRAVFLSYASEDAAAARRVATALRAADVEVWFDQNELTGGDAWDAKIRGQIASCALFVPIISVATQARLEGYFRIEWKLAARRTHAMATARAFLLPIVIDGTRDADAHVPDEFRDVQWTRLRPAGLPAFRGAEGDQGYGGQARLGTTDSERQALNEPSLDAFCARVKKLIGGELGPRPPSAALNSERPGTAAVPRKTRRWIAPAIAALVVTVALAIWQPWKTPAPRTGAAAATTAPMSEANRLVAKAWEQMDKTEMARNELLLAEGYCRQAAALEETNPAVWAAWSAMNTWYYFHEFERVPARKEAARDYAQKALAIDPKSYDARYAWAHFVVRTAWKLGEERPALPVLRELLRERPDEPRALYALGFGLVSDPANLDEGLALLERLAEKHPWFAGRALNEVGWVALFYGRFALAESAADRALKAQPYWNNLGLKATLALRLHGNVELAQTTIDQLPATILQENWGISLAVTVADWRGDHARAIAILETVSRDWLENFFYLGPTSFLSGVMRLKAKQVTAAEKDFRRALELIAVRLGKSPNDPALLYYQAEAQRLLGLREEADKTYRQVREVWPDTFAPLTFEPPEKALEYVRRMVDRGYGIVYVFPSGWWFTAASLRLDPLFENVRRAPGFQALVEAEEQREKRQRAQTSAAGGTKTAGASSEKSNVPDKPAGAEKSVVVLAFANQSDDKANEDFSDGITEELINTLTKITGLRVIARTSAFSFKGKNLPVAEIAKQLNVAYVIDGSVRRDGTRVRIIAQLVNAATGESLWSERFARELKDIFAVQDEIAGEVAKNFQLKLAVGAAPKPVNPEAYQHLLRARYFSRREDHEGWRRSIEECQAALAIDPNFAPAAAEMARCYIHLARFSGIGLAEGFKAARPAAAHALALNRDLAETQNAMGWVQRTADWDWRRADASFRRAYELAPRSATMITDYAVMRNNLGHFDEAIALGRRAVDLDPLNATTRACLSLFLGWAGQFEAAVSEIRRAAELNPGASEWHAYLSRWLVLLGRFDEAAAAAEAEPHERYRQFARVLVLLGRKDRAAAERLLRDLIVNYGDREASYVAECYAYAGEADQAFTWLERAYAHRETFLVWIRGQRTLDSLHADPRWPAFVRKMGLADEQLK